ncbi:MAG: trimeric intracellular cation channel family protein [Bacteroidota bacterium]
MDILYLIDLIGTTVFAISGTATGMKRQMDIFGASVVAFVTAVGGGTLRDILIGSQPVGWMSDLHYTWAILLGILLTFVYRSITRKLHRTLFLFDTIGIGVFTVLGLQKALSFGLHPIIAIMMGIISAVFGGVIRDILCNEVPLIFRKEIYATACLSGGLVYVLLERLFGFSDWITLAAIIVILLIRILSMRFHWSLPVIQ